MYNLEESLENLKDDIRREFKLQAVKSGINEERELAYAYYQATTSNLFLIILKDALLIEMHVFINDMIDKSLKEVILTKNVPLTEAIPSIEAFLALDYSCEDMINKRVPLELTKVGAIYRKHLYEGNGDV
jgi:hypothetical protein